MKKVLLAVTLFAAAFASFAQESGNEDRLYYLDISLGYNVAMPPFSNAKTDVVFLKPRSGGSMSFGFVRKVSDQWGLQVEVLTTTFKVKNSDLANAHGSDEGISQIEIDPYRSTFFGVGAVTFLPIYRRLMLDVKGSLGVNMVEFAKQNFTSKPSQTSEAQSINVSAKRSIAPGALLGGRLRYPIGEMVDVGLKVEYGISYAKFANVQRITSSDVPENPTTVPLPDVKKTVSYLNAGITLGLRF